MIFVKKQKNNNFSKIRQEKLIINQKHKNNKKGNLKGETEFLPIVAQNNAIRIDKTQQNSRFTLCGDRDETMNHILSECSRLTQKEYKTKHYWVGKVIHKELCRKYEFDHTKK